ncbi:MAG: tetratricopeptide repeat protein, partial [Planctomycetes bacterium]|nr:tetratricopeptide repeat protein [Planctomycetota bacterium]
LVRGGSDLAITRCHVSGGWGPAIAASNCPRILVKNSVFMHSMTATTFSRCPDLRIENNVFVSPLITHVLIGNTKDQPYRVERNIFGENTRGKVHIAFASIGRSQSKNCFYVRWAEQDRKLITGTLPGGMTLPEYRVLIGPTDSFVANPHFPGARGFRQGWGPGLANKDFIGLFATNPRVVLEGIGLQPDAFRGFHFWNEAATPWPYDKRWAKKVLERIEQAQALERAGKDAEAMNAFVALTEQLPMEDRLKAELLDRAAQCADRLGEYEQAIELAKRIPVRVLSARRQMALMVKHGKFKELVETFADRPGHGRPYLNWSCPETELPLADVYYYRAIAYAETGDLTAAERDLRIMVEKGKKLGYSPGPTVLDLCWKRLGDFYRDYLKDDAKALEAYRHVLDRTTVYRHDSPMPKPVLSGLSDILKEATESAVAILRRQGRNAKAEQWRSQFLKAQSEAHAFLQKGRSKPGKASQKVLPNNDQDQ